MDANIVAIEVHYHCPHCRCSNYTELRPSKEFVEIAKCTECWKLVRVRMNKDMAIEVEPVVLKQTYEVVEKN